MTKQPEGLTRKRRDRMDSTGKTDEFDIYANPPLVPKGKVRIGYTFRTERNRWKPVSAHGLNTTSQSEPGFKTHNEAMAELGAAWEAAGKPGEPEGPTAGLAVTTSGEPAIAAAHAGSGPVPDETAVAVSDEMPGTPLAELLTSPVPALAEAPQFAESESVTMVPLPPGQEFPDGFTAAEIPDPFEDPYAGLDDRNPVP